MSRTTTFLAAYALTHPLIMPALNPRRMFRYAEESDPEPQPNQQETNTPPAGAQNADTGDGSNATDKQNESEQTIPLSRFNEVNNQLRALQKAQAKADADAKAAEAARLKGQGEWQKLAEDAQAEVDALRPLQDEVAALTATFAEQMTAEIADWPDEVKALAPEGEVSPMVMLDFLAKHRPLAAKLSAPPPANGNGPGPKPLGAAQKPRATKSPINVRRTF